jgi:hypothetical protein
VDTGRALALKRKAYWIGLIRAILAPLQNMRFGSSLIQTRLGVTTSL